MGARAFTHETTRPSIASSAQANEKRPYPPTAFANREGRTSLRIWRRVTHGSSDSGSNWSSGLVTRPTDRWPSACAAAVACRFCRRVSTQEMRPQRRARPLPRIDDSRLLDWKETTPSAVRSRQIEVFPASLGRYKSHGVLPPSCPASGGLLACYAAPQQLLREVAGTTLVHSAPLTHRTPNCRQGRDSVVLVGHCKQGGTHVEKASDRCCDCSGWMRGLPLSQAKAAQGTEHEQQHSSLLGRNNLLSKPGGSTAPSCLRNLSARKHAADTVRSNEATRRQI